EQRRPKIPTGGSGPSSSGKYSSTPLARMASRTVAPSGTSTTRRQMCAGDDAWTTSTFTCATESLTINLLGALGEGIDEGGGDAIEDRPDDRFKRATGEGVAHRVDDLAGVFRQGIEFPGAGQFGKRAIDQMNGDQARV